MRFSQSFLDEICDRVPMSDVIGKSVSWDKRKSNAGRGDWWACCPFHGEKTPSFHCEDQKGRYHCFGCGVSGNHFRFLTELEGLSFPEAVERVADMAGVAMPARDPEAEKRERERASLTDVMEMAAAYFEDCLQAGDGARARAYLRDRGLTGRTIATFRLGFAPSLRNGLKEHLASRGIERAQTEACGLLVHGADIPVSYDRFRDRVMFPILSPRERVIAFGGRAMSPDAPAKYLNSSETELFHKGNVLYNHARARKAVQGNNAAETIVVVEGYMDVIALHQAGIENAVAPLGTALTENQLDLLWRSVATPVLCFDGDDAGQRAAVRVADLALTRLKAGRSVRFALLPAGKDPDDLVRHDGRSPFDDVLAGSQSLADTIWQRETRGSTFETPEERAELETRLKAITATIADDSVRYHYQQDMRERVQAFFRPVPAFAGKGSREQSYRGRGATAGRFGGEAVRPGGRLALSDRLKRSALVRGQSEGPALRESVLALTVINHPDLIHEEFDEIAMIEFESRSLAELWKVLLAGLGDGARTDRKVLRARLEDAGFAAIMEIIEAQARNARIWPAMADAALEDAREAYAQACALHKRTRALKRQKRELERDIAEATEADIEVLMRGLEQVQNEITRLEHQQAIIDGFGSLSGRVRGSVSG